MLLTNTLTKKALEKIIKEFFSKFGPYYSSLMLDSLKFLGFYYATKAGVSISIEDLKTPELKKEILEETEEYLDSINSDWSQGNLSQTEKFQATIDQWHITTESLKNKIVSYYQAFDPANNLYIMAFSGARGNMSQVRQLIGMRGLMADQEGNIIELPIQRNFREGLTSLDYLISAYGARKGVVDTALKTADSGYLTRRLIYVAQDLIIRELDCKTSNGIYINLNQNSNQKNLIGRYLLSTYNNDPILQKFLGEVINENNLPLLIKRGRKGIKIRSSLTCASLFSVCQKCYGWDLSKNDFVDLGQAIGIIAAQSIGEPGTQLTMRTFHTGGIFTSELLAQNEAPISGQLIIPEKLKYKMVRTNHGVNFKQIKQDAEFKILAWNGQEKIVKVPFDSYLHKYEAGFIKKGEIISEASAISAQLGLPKATPLYSPIQGKIHWGNLLSHRSMPKKELASKHPKNTKFLTTNYGCFWIHSGKFFTFPNFGVINLRQNSASKDKSIFSTKIISPFEGIIQLEKDRIKLMQQEAKIEINFNALTFPDINKRNINIKINSLFKKDQYIDIFSLLAYIYLIPKQEFKLYKFNNLTPNCNGINFTNKLNLFSITEKDIWTIYLDEFNKNYSHSKANCILESNQKITKNLVYKNTAFLLEKNGLALTFQKIYPVFLNPNCELNYKNSDIIYENDKLASLITYRQQTEDIVQGLPKIEDLVEARTPDDPTYLLPFPGVVFNFKGTKQDKKETDDDRLRFEPLQLNSEELSSHKSEKTYNYNINFDLGYLPKSEREKRHKNFFTPPGLILSRVASPKLEKDDDDRVILRKNRQRNYIAKNLFRKRKKHHVEKNMMDFIDIGQGINDSPLDPHQMLKCLNVFFKARSGIYKGTIQSINQIQLVLVNSIQAIYNSQGVSISAKHIEIIVRQMTARAKILDVINANNKGIPLFVPLQETEVIRLSLALEIAKVLENIGIPNQIDFEPVLLSSTSASLKKPGFLAASGFQETKRVLIKAALEGHEDWIRGLKECIITGRHIPAGSGFLNYKHYLDTFYFYKDKDVGLLGAYEPAEVSKNAKENKQLSYSIRKEKLIARLEKSKKEFNYLIQNIEKL